MKIKSKQSIWFIGALIFSLMNSASAEEKKTEKKKPVIDAIPYALETQTEKGSFQITNGQLSIVALSGADLYTNTAGKSEADNVPRVLFEPKGDFIFSAKITPTFAGTYDGGGIIVYADNGSWAKMVYEKFKSGKTGIATTVTNGAGDDAYHGTYETESLYLKVARNQDTYVFYTSKDGVDWNYTRNFGIKTSSAIKIGFASQAPISEKATVIFSDIKFRPVAFKNFWQGEP